VPVEYQHGLDIVWLDIRGLGEKLTTTQDGSFLREVCPMRADEEFVLIVSSKKNSTNNDVTFLHLEGIIPQE